MNSEYWSDMNTNKDNASAPPVVVSEDYNSSSDEDGSVFEGLTTYKLPKPTMPFTGNTTTCQLLSDNKEERKSAYRNQKCVICLDTFIEACQVVCGHKFCRFCVNKWMENSNMCPLCRTNIKSPEPLPMVDMEIDMFYSMQSKRRQRAREEAKRSRKAAEIALSLVQNHELQRPERVPRLHVHQEVPQIEHHELPQIEIPQQEAPQIQLEDVLPERLLLQNRIFTQQQPPVRPVQYQFYEQFPQPFVGSTEPLLRFREQTHGNQIVFGQPSIFYQPGAIQVRSYFTVPNYQFPSTAQTRYYVTPSNQNPWGRIPTTPVVRYMALLPVSVPLVNSTTVYLTQPNTNLWNS